MKKILLLAVFLIVAGATMEQKYAYVDMEYILNNIPAYAKAQDDLGKISEQYQGELENRRAEIEKMYSAYQSETSRLSADLKRNAKMQLLPLKKDTRNCKSNISGLKESLQKSSRKW